MRKEGSYVIAVRVVMCCFPPVAIVTSQVVGHIIGNLGANGTCHFPHMHHKWKLHSPMITQSHSWHGTCMGATLFSLCKSADCIVLPNASLNVLYS